MAGWDLSPSMGFNLSTEMPFVQSLLTDELKSQYSGDHGAAHWQECNPAGNPIQKNQKSRASPGRKRVNFTKAQLHVLELLFQTTQYPDVAHREDLARLLHIPASRIQVWFQNRRSKAKRETLSPKKKTVLIEYFPNHQTGGQKSAQRPPNKAATEKCVTALKHSKLSFFPQPPSMSYHPYSYQSPQVQNVSRKAYSQKVSYGANMWVHQQGYNYMAPVDNLCNGATDLNSGSSQKPNIFDYNWFQANQTIASAEAPVSTITIDLNSNNGLNPFSTPLPSQMPIAHNDLYNQSSTALDLGLLDRSTD